MNENHVITSDDERIAAVLRALKKSAKEAARFTENFHPPLGGERYLTDKEVIDLLKVSRRTLQEYRAARKIPFILSAVKSSTGNPTSKSSSRKTTARLSPKTTTGRC